MKSGYESLVWIQDDDGREYVCSLNDVGNEKRFSDDLRDKCMDVSMIIGTERW